MAQLGARVNGIHEVTGSTPVWSTILHLCERWLASLLRAVVRWLILPEHPLNIRDVVGHGQGKH